LLNTPYRYYEYELFAGKLISNMLFMLIGSINSSMNDGQKGRTVTEIFLILYEHVSCNSELSFKHL